MRAMFDYVENTIFRGDLHDVPGQHRGSPPPPRPAVDRHLAAVRDLPLDAAQHSEHGGQGHALELRTGEHLVPGTK